MRLLFRNWKHIKLHSTHWKILVGQWDHYFLVLYTMQTQRDNTKINKSKNLRAKTTIKIWKFYFAQVLTGIVGKQDILIHFNFFFKFSHCLTLFPVFSVHVNWVVFYVTANPFKLCYQETLRKICHVVKIKYLCEFGEWMNGWMNENEGKWNKRGTQRQRLPDALRNRYSWNFPLFTRKHLC